MEFYTKETEDCIFVALEADTREGFSCLCTLVAAHRGKLHLYRLARWNFIAVLHPGVPERAA